MSVMRQLYQQLCRRFTSAECDLLGAVTALSYVEAQAFIT
jgi:hypothetical protein